MQLVTQLVRKKSFRKFSDEYKSQEEKQASEKSKSRELAHQQHVEQTNNPQLCIRAESEIEEVVEFKFLPHLAAIRAANELIKEIILLNDKKDVSDFPLSFFPQKEDKIDEEAIKSALNVICSKSHPRGYEGFEESSFNVVEPIGLFNFNFRKSLQHIKWVVGVAASLSAAATSIGYVESSSQWAVPLEKILPYSATFCLAGAYFVIYWFAGNPREAQVHYIPNQLCNMTTYYYGSSFLRPEIRTALSYMLVPGVPQPHLPAKSFVKKLDAWNKAYKSLPTDDRIIVEEYIFSLLEPKSAMPHYYRETRSFVSSAMKKISSYCCIPCPSLSSLKCWGNNSSSTEQERNGVFVEENQAEQTDVHYQLADRARNPDGASNNV